MAKTPDLKITATLLLELGTEELPAAYAHNFLAHEVLTAQDFADLAPADLAALIPDVAAQRQFRAHFLEQVCVQRQHAWHGGVGMVHSC